MNLKVAAVLILIFLLLTPAAFLQFDWMRQSHDTEMRYRATKHKSILNFCLQNAINDELQMRTAMPESNFTYSFNPYKKPDTSDYVIKTVETMDTTFQVKILKYDIGAIFEIQQFILKGFMPVHLENLEKCLRRCLKSNDIQPTHCYLEYIDLKKNTLLDHTALDNPFDGITSETIPLDILKTVGIKACIDKKQSTMWESKKKEIIKLIAMQIAIAIILTGIYIFRKQIILFFK